MKRSRDKILGSSLSSCLFVIALTTHLARADDSPLTVADLADYRAALTGKASGPITAVGFRALWDHPETYQGRLVRVEGRVVRRFRQGAFATFPPLEEVWIVAPGDNPLCLVFPAPQERGAAEAGALVRFEGTFLKRVEYQGGDGPRLAPLIVGGGPPIVTAPAPPIRKSGGGMAALDWLVGGVLAALVVMVLARQHLRRPARVEAVGPPPEFLPPPTDRNGSE